MYFTDTEITEYNEIVSLDDDEFVESKIEVSTLTEVIDDDVKDTPITSNDSGTILIYYIAISRIMPPILSTQVFWLLFQQFR